MLDSVVEYITQAASSSAFIFCFCNLIIVIILVDLMPSLRFYQQSEIPLSMASNTGKQEINSYGLTHKKTLSSQAGEMSHALKEVAVDKFETEDEDNYCKEEEKKKEEEDDELRRKVEEFIEKVNEGWKAELLSTSSFAKGSNNKEL